MTDTETLRPEVQAAMRELREALRVQGVGSHGPQFTIIRAELLRLAAENAAARGALETLDVEGHKRAEKAEAELATLKARIAAAPIVSIANIGDPVIVLPDHLPVPNSMKGQRVRLVVEE